MRKKIMQTVLCATLLLTIAAFNAQAQAVSAEDLKAQMVKDWERAKAYTDEYLNTMPAEKYSTHPDDSIRTFAQQMLHLASANFFIMMTATDQKPPVARQDLETSPGAQKKDSVLYFVNASYDYCINAVKNSDPAKWGEKKKVFGRFEETRLALIMKTFEHQTHHRGQTTIYIRTQGIKPPQEKLF